MIEYDDQNLTFGFSTERADARNASFYRRFPYPWPPMQFTALTDPHFATVMLHHDVGDWQQRAVPREANIWVAGCGTNQAVFTALRFPKAAVVGSDLSTASLAICESSARQLDISNLTLKQESINNAEYRECFDYIICTGVIHHNADPARALGQLARALKPGGILELMVYNRYHRIVTSAFQKAVALLSGPSEDGEFETELSITQRLIRSMTFDNQMSHLLGQNTDLPEAALADRLLQPIEYSFTVASLDALASSSGLELLTPCLDLFDQTTGDFNWHLDLGDLELQKRFDALPDVERWQVANLLLYEKSPMLWFYLQRKDSGRPRKTVKQICVEFLEGRFVRTGTQQIRYQLTEEGSYVRREQLTDYPHEPSDTTRRAVLAEADGSRTMRELFARAGIRTTFQRVNQERRHLATSAFPYLCVV